MTSSIFESIRLPTGLFPKKPGTNENLRRTNPLITDSWLSEPNKSISPPLLSSLWFCLGLGSR